jgi:putative oxidoreductase
MLTFLGKYRDYAPLVLRILLGLTLVFSHGLPKIMAPDRWEREGQAMANLGITFAPVFWGFMAGATELVAGILFLIGLAVRPASVMVLFIMFVAALNNVVSAGGLSGLQGGRSHPIDFAAGTIALLLLGAGMMSVDRKIGWDR